MPAVSSHRVFISYARADGEKLAGELQEALKDANISVWWDRQAMQSRGRTFLQEIRDAISECESLLAIVSPKALQSAYVESEWQHASVLQTRHPHPGGRRYVKATEVLGTLPLRQFRIEADEIDDGTNPPSP